MKAICAIFLCLACCTLHAQKSKVKFRTINQTGLIIGGDSDVAWHIQSVNGIAWRSFSLGIGVGYDGYFFKSLPLFADIRKNIFSTDNTPYVYANIGKNFSKEKRSSDPWMSTSYGDGAYYDLGIGYSWKMEKGGSFIVSLGYSEKKQTEIYHYGWSNYKETFDLTFRRMAIKAGVSF